MNRQNTSSQSQLQQKRKDQVPMIARFVWAFRSKVITLQRQRAQGVLLIQNEIRNFWTRSSSAFRHLLRQRREEHRRRFFVDVDRIIKAAVHRGRAICIEELDECRELYLDLILARMADLVQREARGRRVMGVQQEDDREKLLDLLLANVPRDVVPGTFEYEEFQDRCHILKLENFQRSMLVTYSIGPRADFAQEWENNVRTSIRMDELEQRIDMIRGSRAAIAEVELLEIERAEEALRPAIEAERDIGFTGMTQHRALTSMFLLLGPGAGSEHDTRVGLILEEEAQSNYLHNKMWQERTMILTSALTAEEQAARHSRRGVPAIEQHEWCQIVLQLYELRKLLLQGEFSANDGLYVSSEAGSRRAIRWDEQRARDRIHQSAAATIFVALVPVEEARARDAIAAAQRDRLGLMVQLLPAYAERVLEPGARRGIFRDWMAFARATTLGMFAITLQALEESARAFIRRASIVDLEYLAGLEYLEFLEMKHRRLITKQMSSRSIVAAAVQQNTSTPKSLPRYQQQRHDNKKWSNSPTIVPISPTSSYYNNNNNNIVSASSPVKSTRAKFHDYYGYEHINNNDEDNQSESAHGEYEIRDNHNNNSQTAAAARYQSRTSLTATEEYENDDDEEAIPPSVALAAAGFPSYIPPPPASSLRRR